MSWTEEKGDQFEQRERKIGNFLFGLFLAILFFVGTGMVDVLFSIFVEPLM